METQIKMHRGTPRRAILLIGQTYRTSSGSVVVVDKIAGGYITESPKGWVQEIHGVWRFPDGHIEWDSSSCGHWKEGV